MPRPYRSGGLHQRKSDGRWIGEVPDGHGGVLRYVTGTDRDEVQRRLDEAVASRSTTSRRSPSDAETVAQYLERWLPTRVMVLAPRTVSGYRALVRHHIVPAIGRVRLRDLDALTVQEMVADVARTHSAQTAVHARNVLSGALRQAVTLGLVPTNVARDVEAPSVRRKPPVYLTAGQVSGFLASVEDDPRHAFYVLAFTTGMRRGEMLALKWPDVDLAHGVIHVHSTLRQLDRYRFVRDPTKTERSTRDVPLAAIAVEALAAHRAKATTPGYVFARPDGRPWPPAEVTREFQRRLRAAGLPAVRLHEARHFAASVLLDETGGDLRTVMGYLGHSSIQTTVATYGGRATESMRKAAKGMDRALGRRTRAR